MPFRNEVVDVVVSLGTSPIEQVGFEIPLFATPHNIFTERVRSYITLDSLVADGFAVGSPAHRWAENVFAGKFAPSSIKIGRITYDSTDITFDQTDYSGILTVNITVKTNTTSFVKSISTASLSAATTPTQAATAVAAAIEADTDIGALVTAAATTNVVNVEPTASTTKVSVGYAMESEYKISNTGTETVAIALPLIADEDNNWYFLSAESHTDTDIKAVAAYAQSATPPKMPIYSTADVDVYNASLSTDIMSELKDQSYDVAGFYNQFADEDWSEGGVAGAIASIDPSFGETLHLKTMPSVTVSKLSPTQQEAIWNKNGNFYKTLKGVNVLWEGKLASGEYFDTVRFSHWLAAKIDEALFGYLYRQSNLGRSVKMSDDDLPVLKQVIFNDVLNVAIRNGGILTGYSADGSVDYTPIVTIPQRKDIPVNDLAARFLDGITVEVVYANALHFIKVRAYITLDRQGA